MLLLLPSWSSCFHLGGPPRRISSNAFPWTTATIAQVCCAVLKFWQQLLRNSQVLSFCTSCLPFFFFSPRRRSHSSAILVTQTCFFLSASQPMASQLLFLERKGSVLCLGDPNSAATWRRTVYTVASCCWAHVRNNVSVWKGHPRDWPAFRAPLYLIYGPLFPSSWLFLIDWSQMQLVKAEKSVILKCDHNWGKKDLISL